MTIVLLLALYLGFHAPPTRTSGGQLVVPLRIAAAAVQGSLYRYDCGYSAPGSSVALNLSAPFSEGRACTVTVWTSADSGRTWSVPASAIAYGIEWHDPADLNADGVINVLDLGVWTEHQAAGVPLKGWLP